MIHALAARARRRYRLVIASVAIAVLLAWCVAWSLAGRALAFNDFHDYWLAAKLIAQGRSAYDIEAMRALAAAEGLQFAIGTGYSYPLPFAVLMLPLAALRFADAVLVFNTVSAIAFGAGVGWFLAWVRRAEHATLGRGVILAGAAASYPPVWGTIINGQANLLVLAPLFVGATFVVDGGRSSRAFLGGVGVGLATIVKIVPGPLVVPLLLARRWSAVAGILTGGLGSLLAAAFIAPRAGAGADRLVDLLQPDPYFTNQSLNGFVSRLVLPSSRTVAVWPGAFDPGQAMLLVTAGLALATVLVLWRSRTYLFTTRGLALGLALALVAALIGAPKTGFWTHSLALLSVGLVVAVEAPDLGLGRLGRTDRLLLAFWFGGAVVQAALWFEPPSVASPLAHLVTLLTSAALVGMLALWLMIARRLGAVRTLAQGEPEDDS